MRRGWLPVSTASQSTSPEYSTALRPRPMSTNAASMLGQHVLHATEVHVADERRVLVARDVVLDEHVVFEHGDLDAAVLGADDHLAVDGLAAGEELRLGDDGAAAAGLATVAATLLLRLEPRRALDALRLGDELDGALARLLRLGGAGRLVPRARRCGDGCGGGRWSRTPARRAASCSGSGGSARDLGRRVEEQLGRDRRDEDLGQQSEVDGRLGPVVLVGGSLGLLVGGASGSARRSLGLGVGGASAARRRLAASGRVARPRRAPRRLGASSAGSSAGASPASDPSAGESSPASEASALRCYRGV